MTSNQEIRPIVFYIIIFIGIDYEKNHILLKN